MFVFFRWLYDYFKKIILDRHRKQPLVLSPTCYTMEDHIAYMIPLFEDLNEHKKKNIMYKTKKKSKWNLHSQN